MSNTTWIALFFVAAIMFLTSQRKKKKEATSEPPKTTLTTGTLPDGQYLAKYVDEQAEGDSRIIILEITDGEHEGTKVPMIFENAAAQNVLKKVNGGFENRLAGEEVALARKLEDNIVEDAEHSFVIRTQDNKAVSIYKYSDEKNHTFMNKLAKDPSFRGQPIHHAQLTTIQSRNCIVIFTVSTANLGFDYDADKTIQYYSVH